MRIFLQAFGLLALFIALPLTAHAAPPSAPANLQLVGGIYTNDTSPTFTWDAVAGAVHYDYRMNDNNYIGIGSATTISLSGMRSGWHTFHLRAQNASGDSSAAASITFEIDTIGPTVPALTPTTATALSSVTLKTTTEGEAWTASCRLSVDGVDVGAMNANSQTFSRAYTFTTSGNHRAYATCVDGDGNTTVGGAETITVAASSQADEGSLIKTANNPAVYYYGDDGMRHAFPTERVFWSWYDDFDDVRTVSPSFMALLPIGKNVTFRPGSVLVRFETDNNVYAIDKGARLRKYISAYITMLDYGTNWTSLFVTLPDVLRNNYGTGKEIDEAADYDKETAWDSISGIGDLFPW